MGVELSSPQKGLKPVVLFQYLHALQLAWNGFTISLAKKKILTITTKKKKILAFMIILTSDKVKGRQNLELALLGASKTQFIA